MSIYHHSVSIVKRSAGKSSVAAAAYRSGQKLTDERTGIIHDYTKKIGVNYSLILTPIAADWIADRQQLWNKIEATEKRYDARLSREVSLALPCELDRDHQIALVHEYVKENYVNRGMIADVNFHNLESNNPHVHIMLSLRRLEIDEHGQVFFGNKNREWDSRTSLLEQRRNWEVMANKFLADAGYNRVRIDCRSLEAQGIDRIPQVHLGVHVSQMKARGISTRIGDEYDRINLANAKIKSELEDIYKDRLLLVDLDEQCKSLHAKIRSLETRDLNYFEKVDPDVLARINSENQTRKYPTSVDREDLISSIGGNDRVQRIAHWCHKNVIIPIEQNEFTSKTTLITARISAVNVDSRSIAFVFIDTMRQDKLKLTCDRSSGQILSVDGLYKGGIVPLIKKIDDLAIQEILRGFRKTDKTDQVNEPKIDEPEIDKVGIPTTPDRVSAPEIDKVETPITPTTPTTPDRVVPKAEIETTIASEQVITKTDTPETTIASEQVITKTDRKTTPRRRSNTLEPTTN